jgi:hypothetical protein
MAFLPAGDVNPRVRTMIVAACAVTTVIAFYGMRAMWESAEWVEESYLTGSDWAVGRSRFWYTNGVGLCTIALIALAWLPRFRISQLLRVAVVLPVIHLGAIIAAALIWPILDGDVAAKLAHLGWEPHSMGRPDITLPQPAALAAAFVAIVLVAIAIKRRHGEWAHATVMLALSYLVLLGMWLPVLSRFAVRRHDSEYAWRDWFERALDSSEVAKLATIPPAIVAIVFVVIAFRCPQLFERLRAKIRIAAWSLFTIAMMLAMSLPDEGWMVYFESSYLVMSAIVFAIASLVLLIAVTSLEPLRARWHGRNLASRPGVIADDEQGEVARFEITSWLRGPRLAMRSFAVTTSQGNVPISGAKLLVALPESTTTLDIGEHVDVLAPGDRVTIAGRNTAADGHPFRASDATEIAIVSTAPRYRFSDIVLVVWRPAVAYLAILVAVAAPYLSIFLTD